jgi:hypothetical protein
MMVVPFGITVFYDYIVTGVKKQFKSTCREREGAEHCPREHQAINNCSGRQLRFVATRAGDGELLLELVFRHPGCVKDIVGNDSGHDASPVISV